MPSVVQTQTLHTVPYMLKDRGTDPVITGFTAVNGSGRASPPEPRRLNGSIASAAMAVDSIHVRPHSQIHSPPLDQKSLPGREDWSAPRPSASENGVQHNDHRHSISPDNDGRDTSPNSPGKRKRSDSPGSSSSSSPEGTVVHSRRRLAHSLSPIHTNGMDHSHQRTLPPIDRAEHDRSWPPHEADVRSHNHYSDAQYRDSRGMDPSQDPSTTQSNGAMTDRDQLQDRSGTTEMTRAGVQVDPKKRKRQFANRTKTGCGTCRRRKKKCDEAKPECNNCIRGGFICEGYAHKVPWSKNGTAKPPPVLQAKDRYPADPATLYHNHGTTRESYQEPTSGEGGARSRPIVVEEHDPRSAWGNNWDNPAGRHSYHTTERPKPEYAPPPPPPTNGARPPSNDSHPQHASQFPQRPHNPRIYHHTPQTMSQVVSTSAAVTAEAALHHQSQQPQPPHAPPPSHHQPATAGPPVPPPSRYHQPPARPQRTEKEKMLNGEPFMPYAPQLHSEREQCKGALYRLNSTSNNHLEITREERDRHFRALVAAKWTQHYRGPDAPPPQGSVGNQVYVDTPFHCEYGYNLHIGDYVTIGTGCRFLDSGRITIGRNTTIDASVLINSRRAPEDTKAMKGSRRTDIAADVHIGENVYIGPNCIIYAGVKIGTGAIIEGGSVVKRDIPRDVVVSGPTAQVKTVLWDD